MSYFKDSRDVAKEDAIKTARGALARALSDVVAAGSIGSSVVVLRYDQDGVRVVVTATVTVEVEGAVPVLVDDNVTTAPNKSVVVDVLANDSDPLGRTLKIVAVQSPTTQGGRAEIIEDGKKVRYTPPSNTGGITDTFTYEVDVVS
jgi:hypothetical protein